jgi:hypothetical protein
MFIILVGLVALLVASCAAFFSVQGLANLYSGQFLAVCIMASSLEVGKLIAASYLHRFWNKTTLLLKTYLIVAVLILMGITSLGIFGFLSSAYQANHSKIELVNTKKEVLIAQRVNISQEIDSLKERASTLNAAREAQEKRLPSMSKVAAKPIYEDIAKSSEEISKIQSRAEDLSKKIFESDEEIIKLESERGRVNDIGTLQFVANIFHIQIEEVVKWFTLALVIVFDPLAVCLVLAYNNISTSTYKKLNTDNYIEPIFSSSDAKYRG